MLVRTTLALTVLTVLVMTALPATANPSGTNVVINEIYCDPPTTFDGAEYVELYNPTASAINIGGWVLCGTEFDQTCGGEDRWQFPVGTSIASHAYLVVAKDGNEAAWPTVDDSFYKEFGFTPDFEMYDPSFVNDHDDAGTPNLTLLDNDPATNYSDEIQLVGGRGYGVVCGGTSNADVVYLYATEELLTPVDLTEYRDAVACGLDPCLYDDVWPYNAFPSIPPAGTGLGRSPVGGDTDNSEVDLQLMVPTPKAVNTFNAPPEIADIMYGPTPPNDTQTTTVRATITDDGSIASAEVYYNAGGSGWLNVPMTETYGDSVYFGHIPIQVDGTQVQYYVRAVDDQGATANYPPGGANNPYLYSVGYTTIYDVQFVPSGGDASPLVGQAVNVRGIVTAAQGEFATTSFWIHEGTGAFKGIKCYVPSYEGRVIEEGDDMTVCGTVTEYNNETEISLSLPWSLVWHGSWNPNYGYTDVTTAQMTPLNVDAERYEGQLVRVASELVVITAPDQYGDWYAGDESHYVMVGDQGDYVYDAEVDDVIAQLVGIGMYFNGKYKIEPRYDADIVGPPRIMDVTYDPVPPMANETIEMTATMNDKFSISSAELFSSLSPTGPWFGTVMVRAPLRGDEIWRAQIGPFANGDRVYYYIECTDGGGMDARAPSTGSYSFYVGTLPIASVQEVPLGGDDTSPLNTLAVNVQGYVTAEPGLFNAHTFYIADASARWSGVRVFDRTGTVAFNRGDYVVCCGQVAEYQGETEIALHFPGAAVTVPPPKGEPIAPLAIWTDDFVAGAGEMYEGVYGEAQSCYVNSLNLGSGQWSICNGDFFWGACTVGTYADYDYQPVIDDDVWVRGVVVFDNGLHKIQPRGNEDIAVNPVGVPDGSVGSKFGLAQNMPNPFNPKTSIAFSLADAGDVTLVIYDASGRKVATLVDGPVTAGEHRVVWDGRSDGGEKAATGVYFYKLSTGDKDLSRKMVLLK
jgi:DNA/RNA endonuclease YhcR with UshA esterase domain